MRHGEGRDPRSGAGLFSLDDAFVVGVGCDLVGGWFLGRALLTKPVVVRERAATRVGVSPPAMAGMIASQVDGEFGLVVLALALQTRAWSRGQ